MSALNNVRLARCFFYVSGVLEQVIRNGGHVGTVQKAEFANALLQAVDKNSVKKLNVVRITNWLVEKGYMVNGPIPDGRSRRVPTAAGRDLGMTTQLRQAPDGEYLAVYYNSNAQ